MAKFKTQKDACRFLQSKGFKVSKSRFNRACKSGRIPRDADGAYDEGALLAYAATELEATEKVEDRIVADAASERLIADAKLKALMAERTQLKLDLERGKLIQREDAEIALAARASFFKSEIMGFGRRVASEVIDVVGGKMELIETFIKWWDDKTADWMNAWADESVVFDEGEEAEDEEESNG